MRPLDTMRRNGVCFGIALIFSGFAVPDSAGTYAPTLSQVCSSARATGYFLMISANCFLVTATSAQTALAANDRHCLCMSATAAGLRRRHRPHVRTVMAGGGSLEACCQWRD